MILMYKLFLKKMVHYDHNFSMNMHIFTESLYIFLVQARLIGGNVCRKETKNILLSFNPFDTNQLSSLINLNKKMMP